MEEILDELPLLPVVRAAILDREGVLGAALSAALQYEAGCKRLAADTRFPPAAISRAYVDAVN
ncbi:MAG TPA: hypothetical protein VFG04_22855 [Planctomycetaceae bacterium]|jgi:hypothetical protein|nr:hypothetical protein [Planctomycetaceae bacterium]